MMNIEFQKRNLRLFLSFLKGINSIGIDSDVEGPLDPSGIKFIRMQNSLSYIAFLFRLQHDRLFRLTFLCLFDLIRQWYELELTDKELAQLILSIQEEYEAAIKNKLFIDPILKLLEEQITLNHKVTKANLKSTWTSFYNAVTKTLEGYQLYDRLYMERGMLYFEYYTHRTQIDHQLHEQYAQWFTTMVATTFNQGIPALPANHENLTTAELTAAIRGIVLQMHPSDMSKSPQYIAACQDACFHFLINESSIQQNAQKTYLTPEKMVDVNTMKLDDENRTVQRRMLKEKMAQVMVFQEAERDLAVPYQAVQAAEQIAAQQFADNDRYFLPIIRALEDKLAVLAVDITTNHEQYMTTLLDFLSYIPKEALSQEQKIALKTCKNQLEAVRAAYQQHRNPLRLPETFQQYAAALKILLSATESNADPSVFPEGHPVTALLTKMHAYFLTQAVPTPREETSAILYRIMAVPLVHPTNTGEAEKSAAIANALPEEEEKEIKDKSDVLQPKAKSTPAKSPDDTSLHTVEPTHEFRGKMDEMHQEAPVDIPKHAEQYLTTKEELITTFETYHLELKQDTACPQEIIKLSEAVMAQVALLIQSHYKKTSLSGIDKVSEKCDELSLHTPLPPEIENIVSVLVELKEKMTCENSALKPHS